MIGQVILEGVGLGAMLMLVCAIGIRNGAVAWPDDAGEDQSQPALI